MIFLAKGNAKLGFRTMNENGEIIDKQEAHFETSESGGSIIVGLIDDETMEIDKSSIDLFGDFDPAAYLNRVYERLQPTRRGNIPDFEFIAKNASEDYECPFVDNCQDNFCSECIVSEWMYEKREQEVKNGI